MVYKQTKEKRWSRFRVNLQKKIYKVGPFLLNELWRNTLSSRPLKAKYQIKTFCNIFFFKNTGAHTIIHGDLFVKP